MSALRDIDESVRISSARALGDIGSPQALEALLLAFASANRAVQVAICDAIAALIDRANAIDPTWIRSDAVQVLLPKLVLVLPSGTEGFRRAATGLLDAAHPGWLNGQIGRMAAPSLIDILKDKSHRSYESEYAALLLGQMKHADAVEPLTHFPYCKNAVWALGEIGDRRAITSLILALAHYPEYEAFSTGLRNLEEVKAIRKEAQCALEKIETHWRFGREAEVAISELIGRLEYRELHS